MASSLSRPRPLLARGVPWCLLAAVLACGLPAAVRAQPEPARGGVLDALAARPIGPANMGGRIVDVAVVEAKPAHLYVAAATGGVWKTVNNGTTWEPVLDRAGTGSVGAVAVAPSDPDVVWVGTGEANPRNSVTWGDGVYRSTDGGRSWRNVGLRATAHIGRIVVHPTDPDTAYVAALGRLWGPSEERGVYRTTDGGRSWQRVLFLDADTGVIDLAMDPSDPAVLYAAAYHVRRDAFAGGNPAVQTGPAAGLYRTTDAGKNWVRLTEGLPTRPLGRCGVAVSRKDPRVVYAVVQTDRTVADNIGQPARAGGDPGVGGVFRSADRGETWTKVNDLCPRPFYYGQVRIDPQNERRVYVLGLALHVSIDGGRTFRDNGARNVHSDHHALWIDPHDPDHLVLGGDGGLYVSYDRGAAWEHVNNLPISQFYSVAVDVRRPYRVYGGLQDNGTWYGPSATRDSGGIATADWLRALSGDGFQCGVDAGDPNVLYAEAQWGALHRIDLRTGQAGDIRPQPRRGAPAYRFNWNSPLVLSPHEPHTLYYGGNFLFRSADAGEHWDIISPDLTYGRPGPSPDAGHTLTAVAESPLRRGLLYAGSDDGRLTTSRDGGKAWLDFSDNVPGPARQRWVGGIECSHFAPGTVYLAIDRHRHDDRAPYLFRTADEGVTWESLAGGLAGAGPVRVVREDPRNRSLLFVGTEAGLFASLDAGAAWHRLGRLPPVPVYDLVVHPRERELVIATHGRGLYVLDVAALEELTSAVLAEGVHLFEPQPAVAMERPRLRAQSGHKPYTAPNPPAGAVLSYYLREPAAARPEIAVLDAGGRTIANLTGDPGRGLHQVVWGLRRVLDARTGRLGTLVDPGEYTVRLRVGATVQTKTLQVQADTDERPPSRAN